MLFLQDNENEPDDEEEGNYGEDGAQVGSEAAQYYPGDMPYEGDGGDVRILFSRTLSIRAACFRLDDISVVPSRWRCFAQRRCVYRVL